MPNRKTRRGFLTAAGAGVVTVLAGCSSVPLVGHPDEPDDDRLGPSPPHSVSAVGTVHSTVNAGSVDMNHSRV